MTFSAMKKFQYGFQKIVDLKSNEKTQAEWLLSTAIGKLQLEEQTLEELQSEKRRLQDELHASSTECAPVAELLVLQQYIEHLERLIGLKLKDVQAAQKDVFVNRQNVATKMLDEKVWLNARDKAKQNYVAEFLRVEQQELDEMATMRFARRGVQVAF